MDDTKGSIHYSYCGNNWLVMMMNLTRHKNDFDVEKVKASINNANAFNKIHLCKYENMYFVDGDGNHRVCQAKFLGVEMVPCEVTEYVLSETFSDKNLPSFSEES